MNNWQPPEEQKWMSGEIRVFLSRQKRTTGHLSKQLCNHPAKPLVLHNTQWIFITSPTCFLPSSQALPGQLHPREQSNNAFSFLLSKSQRMKKDVDINVPGELWYTFNVWEKIETQGENKWIFVSEESDIYKCVSASLVSVLLLFFFGQSRQMSHVLGQTSQFVVNGFRCYGGWREFWQAQVSLCCESKEVNSSSPDTYCKQNLSIVFFLSLEKLDKKKSWKKTHNKCVLYAVKNI